MYRDKLTVTKPSLPDLGDFTELLKEIWDNRQLTNIGEFHRRFESALCEYLGVEHLSLFCNGTMALQTGLQAMRLTGEVITTPFTFPATAHTIYWNRCKPVFCDIEEETFGLDPKRLEPLITPETTAIMPVHVFGRACKTKEIDEIAKKYGLKVIYDAAHAFGVRDSDGTSLVSNGDLSMMSFHSTKVFNTIEGGALTTSDPDLKKRLDYLKNFGIADETTVIGPGSNGKMNEVIAAYGLLQLANIEEDIAQRAARVGLYREMLASVEGITLVEADTRYHHNHCYLPILVDEDSYGESRERLMERLEKRDILTRRYFFPLLTEIPCYQTLPSANKAQMQVAHSVSRKVLCLPLYSDLKFEDVEMVCETIANSRS